MPKTTHNKLIKGPNDAEGKQAESRTQSGRRERDNPTSKGNITLTPFHQLLYLDKCRIHNTLADAIQGRPYTDGGGGRGVDTPMRIAYERDFAF